MSRELTAGELVTLRTRPIHSHLYLVAQKPRTVWTSTVTAAPAADDRATQFTANDVATADMLAGMTIRVESAGGAVKGYVRLRARTPGNATIGIGECSDIAWAVGDVVTCLDEFGIWIRPIRIVDETTIYMDETAYGNQHTTCLPVAVMGPPVVARLSSGSVTIHFDASDSWEANGGLITYSWSVTPNTGVTITDGATATPQIQFTHAVCHRVTLAVTSGGVTSYGYRYVFILPETGWTSEDDSYLATPRFTMSDCRGDYESGGWESNISLYENCTKSDLHERTLIVICSDDYYGSTLGNVGVYTGDMATGRNNILMVGWLADETVAWNPNLGYASFQIGGPQYWLDRETNLPVGIFDTEFPSLPGTTNGWAQFDDLTVDKALWHLWVWQTTGAIVTDLYVTNDTRQLPVAEAPVGSIWRQILTIAEESILARPACDKLGRVFVEIDQQFLPNASRTFPDLYANSAAPLGIHAEDWRDTETIEDRTVAPSSQIDVSGVSYLNGAAAALFSLAPGHMPSRFGAMERRERLLLADQAGANEMTGLVNGKLINRYPSVQIPLAYHIKLVDIAPRQYVSQVIAAADTERGIEWPDSDDAAAGLNAKRLIPRRVSSVYDYSNGVLLTDMECEAESWQTLAVTGDAPPTPADPPPPPAPPVPPPPPPAYELATEYIFMTTANEVYWTDEAFDLSELTPSWTKIAGPVAITGGVSWFDAAEDGSAIYCSNLAPGSIIGELWRCTNFRTNPAAPNWTLILQIGDVALGHTILGDFRWRVWNSKVYLETSTNIWPNCIWGCYDGGWTWQVIDPGTGQPSFKPFHDYYLAGAVWDVQLRELATTNLYDGSPNINDNHHFWRSVGLGNIFCFAENAGTHYVRDCDGHAYVWTIPAANEPDGGNDNLRGAWYGAQMCYVDKNGNAMIDDAGGGTFDQRMNWDTGIIWPILASGGPFMCWQRYTTLNLGEILRVSQDGWVVDYMSRNGNFWAIATVGNKVMVNSAIMEYST